MVESAGQIPSINVVFEKMSVRFLPVSLKAESEGAKKVIFCPKNPEIKIRNIDIYSCTFKIKL